MKEVINNCDSIKTISGEKYRVCEGCCFRCRHDCSGVLGWTGLECTGLDWTGWNGDGDGDGDGVIFNLLHAWPSLS